MNIYSNFNIYTQNYNNNSLSFKSAKARKLITKLTESRQISKEKITFNELESMYNELGYDIFRKRGSHAVIHMPDGVNLPVVIPHGNKYVSQVDLKRFLLIQQGKIEEALRF